MKKRSNRKILCVSLALSFVVASADFLYVGAEEYPVYSQYLSGLDSRETPGSEADYTIVSVSTQEDLIRLAQDCQLDSWSRDKFILLENDIVLAEDSEIVIPSFGGIFEGNGHSISNLQITANGSALGLFRYIQSGAVVRNLSVSGNVQPGGEGNHAGLLAGVNYGQILDCSVSGNVTGVEGVGGIAGVNEISGEIRRCRSFAVVTGERCSGGICGVNRGVLNDCTNAGNINAYSRDVTYSLEDITIENLEDADSVANMAVHTDTGGIAGYSQGKIYYCSNSGTVGYQHVGYNTGGIVGRLHQGYLQNCTNTGNVLGRKDVGGIAGQMEPFLEIQYMDDKLNEISRETDAFLNLLEKAGDDLQSSGQEIFDLTGEISGHLGNVSSISGSLIDTMGELWYIYNQELTVAKSDLERLNRETSEAGNRLEEDASWGDIRDDVESYIAALRRFGEDANRHVSDVITATNDKSGGINDNLDSLDNELATVSSQLKQLSDLLEESGEQTSADMDALQRQAKVLRRSVDGLRDDLFRYEGISVEDVSDETPAGASSEEPGAQGFPEGETEEAYYDTTSFQQGKITLCVNTGNVEADTNVGGIVGQVATEYDFDPEDDITFTGEESFSIEQTVKAVIRESRNEGVITAKKDYVGGIVGKADYGAVISCQSYGAVSSTGGSYAGGIAGFSGYCIRNCYFMGPLSGKNYVGGIAGSGSDVFYSYAYPEIDYSGEYAGSIAGRLEENGTLYGNYYVQGTVPGVDSIGYEGGAEPLAYEEFCGREEVPEAFREFTVRFWADGEEIAVLHCRYGEALDKTLIPEIPEKEGYYGTWPEFDYDRVTGNRLLEAQYEKWISSLASEETSQSGKTMLLIQGDFLPENRLLTETVPEGTRLSVVVVDEEGNTVGKYEKPVLVRALCEDSEIPVEKAAVELWNGENYVRTPAKVVGSYLEFTMEQPGIFRIVKQQKQNTRIIIVCAAVAAAGAVIALCVAVVRRRRRHKSGASAEKTAD